jgi:hypothetical protein
MLYQREHGAGLLDMAKVKGHWLRRYLPVTYFEEPTGIEYGFLLHVGPLKAMRLKNIRFDGEAMVIGTYMIEKQVTIIGCFGREWIFQEKGATMTVGKNE